MNQALLAIPILFLGAVLSLLLPGSRLRALSALVTQAVAAVLVLVAFVPLLGGAAPMELTVAWSAPLNEIVFRADALSAFFLVWSLPMTWLGTLYATGYLAPYVQKGRDPGWHYALLNMTALTFVLIYTAQNAMVFLLGWEIAAAAAWLGVIWDYGNQKVRFAGFNYLVSTHIGLLVLVAAFMLMNGKTGSMDFAAFGTFLATPSSLRGPVFLLLGVAFALKSAFFPFHTWLPRAHAAAPAHISALMSGVIHKAGLFGFLRFVMSMGKPEEWMGWATLGFGAASAFMGVLYTANQRDLKRLLGYSSTENVGIAAMGFGVGMLGWAWDAPTLTACGFVGGMFHLLNHAVFKCLLFYAAGSINRAAHTVDLERFGGLVRRLPLTAWMFLIGSLAGSALPPLNGFFSEFLIYGGMLGGDEGNPSANVMLVGAAALLAFVGAVSAFATTRAYGLTFLGTPRDAALHVEGEAGGGMAASMLLHAGLAIAIGICPEIGLSAVTTAARSFGDPQTVAQGLGNAIALLTPVVWIARVMAVLVLTVSVWAWLRGRAARRSVTWGCGYTAGTARLQYTGSSFAEQIQHLFGGLLGMQRREQLPQGPFPAGGQLETNPVDAVERPMFRFLDQSEAVIRRVVNGIGNHPGISFGAGLFVLVVIAVLVMGEATK